MYCWGCTVPIFVLLFAALFSTPSAAQEVSVYRGPIHLPDFAGRDHHYSAYRTRILNEMRTGPNFDGHYAMVEIGCGTSCRLAYIADLTTGRVQEFPYGGEQYYGLWLRYGVKNSSVEAQWLSDDQCMRDTLEWTGLRFISTNLRAAGPKQMCDL